MNEVLQQAGNALSLGSIYALIALGVAILFSILGLINFAHGELLTVAGYSMFLLATRGVPWLAIIPAAILSSLIAAVILERVAFRPVRGAPPVAQLLTSFAVSLVLQNVFLLFVGARPKAIPYPNWVDAQFSIGSVPFQWLDVTTLLATIAVLVGLNAYLRGTVTGLALRSAAEDFPTTRLMGVRANWIVVGAFVASGLLAGLAAVFYFAASPVVTPTSGFVPLLKGFVASAIGGLGSLSGAVLGGFLLAAIEVGLEATLPGSLTGYVDALAFVVLILILLVRPAGLLGARAVQSRV